MNSFRTKLITIIILLIILVVIIVYSIIGLSINFSSTNKIKSTRSEMENSAKIVSVNNTDVAYDTKSNTYFYSISKENIDNLISLKLEFDGNYKYKIKGQAFNLVRVDFNKTYKLIIYNKKSYYETKIVFTNLPIVNISTEDVVSTIETKSVFNYTNSNLINKTVESNSLIRTRGASSSVFPKKSYKIKMYNKSFSKEKETIISNFYYGSSFILDAVYRDPSKVRNLLSIDLWNMISNDFSDIDINNEFVELFINDEYMGLYILTEPINRRSLKLNKSDGLDTSIIIKVIGWNTYDATFDFSDIKEDFYNDFELKYPNDEELYSLSWKTFLEKSNDYFDPKITNTYDIISNTWNVNNFVDMIVFNAFINNVDNALSKNNYYYMKNINSNEIYIQPWDMEYSFGLSYEASSYTLAFRVEDYDSKVIINFDIYPNEIKKLIVKRYNELRKNVLTEKYINKLLDKYLDELSLGATKRDSKLWLEYDIEEEIDFIRKWVKNRIKFLDEYMSGVKYE